MSASNPLNVYTGPDSLQKYYDPDIQPPLPLVEVPASLNPFYADGVRIYAKMMSMHPANNVKALPAMNLLASAMTPDTKTVIEYSSGSTVISMSLMARIFHRASDTRAYLSNKTSDAKLKLMQFFGLDLTLFGGPSQPEPLDKRGGICKAAADGSTNVAHAVNPNQYENDANWQAHERWTGPQILKQLPSVNVICAGMGTSGTMTGIGTFIKRAKPSVVRVGVCTAAGDRVPGPRSYALLAPVKFPWRASVDAVEHVGSHDSYRLSMQLSREGLICGPSSGFNLKGLYQFLEKRKAAGTLGDLADSTSSSDGLVHCVFICCDLPYQYISEYFTKLGPEHFPAIHNNNLAAVDLYRYDEAWEVPATDALQGIYDVRVVHRRGRPRTRPGVVASPAPSSASALSSTSPSLSPPSSSKSSSSAPSSGSSPASSSSSSSSSPAPLLPSNAAVVVMALKPHSMLIDLRAADDFSRWHLPGAVSAPLASLAADTTPSPFADTGTLERQWCELEALFGGASSAITTAVVMPPSPTKTTMTTTAAAAATTAAKDLTAAALRGQRVVLLCYGGDTARVATSVLRAKGVDAFSVRGGVRALAHEWPDMLHAESDTSDANGLADAVDDDDDDDDDEELDEPASPTTDNGGAVNGDIRIGIHDDGDDFISTGVGIASGGDSDGHMAWPASVMLHDVDGKAPRHNSSGSGSSMNSGSMAAAAAAAVAHPLNAPSAFGAGGK